MGIDRIAIGYVRLSRADIREGEEPIEEKLALRKQIVMRIAAINKVDLREDNIYIEQESGTTIDQRPKFLLILSLIDQGRVSHLVATALDRLMRPTKRDEVRIEEALKRGRVTVVTGDSPVLPFGDRDFDVVHGLTYQIKSAVAFHESAKFSKRLRDSNLERIIEGRRTGGKAVYGYRWVPTTWRGKDKVEPGRYETVEEEYEIVKEIFQRIVNEGMYSIVRDLNERFRETGSPAPSGLSRSGKGSAWRASGLRQIVFNPFYAGYPSHRTEVQTYGDARRVLPREEWGMSKCEQTYEHPVDLAAWEDLIQRVQERGTQLKSRIKAASDAHSHSNVDAHSHRDTILTGTIQCVNGYKMQGSGRAYECKCHVERATHAQRSVRKHRAEGAVLNILQQALSVLPDDLLGRSKKPEKLADKALRRRQASIELQKERETRSRLIRDTEFLREKFGTEYDKEVDKCLGEIKRLETEIEILSKQIHHQNPGEVIPVVTGIRNIGFEAFWDAATVPERREIIGLFFETITVLPPPTGKHETRGLEVVMQPWSRQFYTPPRTVALPTRSDDWRVKNGLEVKVLSNRGRKLRPQT